MKKLAVLGIMGVLVCVLIGSNTVWAGCIFTPVSGTMTFEVDDETGSQWFDEEGILHIRDRIMYWNFTEGSLVGSGWGIFNVNIDPISGIGDTQGFHYFDVSYGGISGTFAGHAEGYYTGFFMVADYIGRGEGGFAGVMLRTTANLFYFSDQAAYEGVLQDPHGGGGGSKAVSTDSQTWGSVKALYR